MAKWGREFFGNLFGGKEKGRGKPGSDEQFPGAEYSSTGQPLNEQARLKDAHEAQQARYKDAGRQRTEVHRGKIEHGLDNIPQEPDRSLAQEMKRIAGVPHETEGDRQREMDKIREQLGIRSQEHVINTSADPESPSEKHDNTEIPVPHPHGKQKAEHQSVPTEEKISPKDAVIETAVNENGEHDPVGVRAAKPGEGNPHIKAEGSDFIVINERDAYINPHNQLPEANTNQQLVRRGPQAVQRYGQVVHVDARQNGNGRNAQGQIESPVRGYIEAGEKALVRQGSREVVPVITEVPVIEDGVKVIGDGFETRQEKLILADLDAIVESYAHRLAEQKLNEHISKKANIFNRWWVRLAEDGYYKKYMQEAKAEIMKNRNLLSQIEARWGKQDEKGVPLKADATDIHYEILDKVIEAYERQLVAEKSEVKADNFKSTAADLETARLFADLAMGKITSREQFDKLVEEKVVPNVPGISAEAQKHMYANNLFELAQSYKKEVEEKISAAGKEFGPEQEQFVRQFMEGTLRLDIMLGEKARDMSQRRPNEALNWAEKWLVDRPQNGFMSGNSRFGRTVGRVLANPVLVAGVSGLLTRGALKAAGIGVASALTMGSATAIIAGTALGAGAYMGLRAHRERKRDVMRRENEAMLGQHETETHALKDARKLIEDLKAIEARGNLSQADKEAVADIQARLTVQETHKVDLIGVSKEEGEKFGTKFMAETDLKAALKEFFEKNGAQYGATEAERQKVINKLIGEAERRLIPDVERVNKEVAGDMKKHAIVTGLKAGALAAFGTALFGGHLTSAAKWTLEQAGFSFDRPPVWVEELKHVIQERGFFNSSSWTELHEDAYSGPTLDKAPSFVAATTEINLPPNYNIRPIMDAAGNRFIGIEDPSGRLMPGVDRIPVDASGNIPVGALRPLETVHGWQVTETPGITGRPGGVPNSVDHPTSFKRVDWHDTKGEHYSTVHGRDILFEGKQQELYLAETGGKVEADLNRMISNVIKNIEGRYAQFGTNNDSSVDVKLSHVESKLMEWYRAGGVDEVAKHFKINIIPTADANAHNLGVLSSGAVGGKVDLSAFRDVLMASGATLRDGGLGVFRMEAVLDVDGELHPLATASGHDAISGLGDEVIVDKKHLFTAVPKDAHGVEYPAPVAGYRRELDKDLDKQRDEKKQPAVAVPPPVQGPKENTGQEKEVEKQTEKPRVRVRAFSGPDRFFVEKPGKVPENLVENIPAPVNQSESAPSSPEKPKLDQAFGAIEQSLNANSLTEQDLENAASKFGVTKLELVTRCLEARNLLNTAVEEALLRAAQKRRADFDLTAIRWQMLESFMRDQKPSEQQPRPEPVVRQEKLEKSQEEKRERRESRELSPEEFLRQLNSAHGQFNVEFSSSGLKEYKSKSETDRKQAAERLGGLLKKTAGKFGDKGQVKVVLRPGEPEGTFEKDGSVKLFIPLEFNAAQAEKKLVGGYERVKREMANQSAGQEKIERTNQKTQNKNEGADREKNDRKRSLDLLETLSAKKFGKLDIAVDGAAQNKLEKYDTEKRNKTVESFEEALGAVNDKLRQLKKGKVRIVIGAGKKPVASPSKKEFQIPISTPESKVVAFLAQELNLGEIETKKKR